MKLQTISDSEGVANRELHVTPIVWPCCYRKLQTGSDPQGVANRKLHIIPIVRRCSYRKLQNGSNIPGTTCSAIHEQYDSGAKRRRCDWYELSIYMLLPSPTEVRGSSSCKWNGDLASSKSHKHFEQRNPSFILLHNVLSTHEMHISQYVRNAFNWIFHLSHPSTLFGAKKRTIKIFPASFKGSSSED